MLPESLSKSSGRMSAPFQEPANKANIKAQSKYQVRLRLGAATPGMAMEGGTEVSCMLASILKSVQCGQLLVNQGHALFLDSIRKDCVRFNFVALAEKIQLTDWHQLPVI